MIVIDPNVRKCGICGKPITNKKSHAKKCDDCRRKAWAAASKRAKERKKRKGILIKAEKSGVKDSIEFNKSEQILEDLREELEKGSNEELGDYVENVGLSSIFPPSDFFEPLGGYGGRRSTFEKKQKEAEIKPFKEIVEKKVKEEVEKESEKIKNKKSSYY